jgi:hypothetical protein
LSYLKSSICNSGGGRRRRRLPAALGAACLLLSAFPIGAAEVRLIPSVSVREEYNDNVLYTSTNVLRDFITTISPGLQFTSRSEKAELSFLTRADAIAYKDNSEFNDVDQTYRGKAGYRLTPQLGLFAEAGYLRDSSPGRDIEVTGLVTTNVRRERTSGAAGGDYLIGENTTATLNYSYGRDRYAGQQMVNETTHSASLGFSHDLGRYLDQTKAIFNLGYDRFEYEGALVQNYSGTVGFSRDLTEKWTIVAVGGVRSTTTEFDTAQHSNQGQGWVGHASLAYGGEKTRASLSFTQNIMAASGTSGPTERTSAALDCSGRLAYEWYAFLSAGYFWNRSDRTEFNRTSIDEETAYVSPGIRYEFNRDVSVESSYRYSQVHNKQTDTRAERNIIMVRLLLQHRFFE